MSAPSFVTFSDMNEYEGSFTKSRLSERIRSILGAGSHEFESLSELFDKLGISHLTTGEVKIRNVCLGDFLSDSDKEMFAMSYRRFASFVHGMKGVRIAQFSHVKVERECAPRVLIIVSF